MDYFVTPQEAAVLLALSPRTLARYRQRGSGPAFSRFGGAVRYRMQDLLAWTG